MKKKAQNVPREETVTSKMQCKKRNSKNFPKK